MPGTLGPRLSGRSAGVIKNPDNTEKLLDESAAAGQRRVRRLEQTDRE